MPFNTVEALAQELNTHPHLLWCLDYDGTLTPIVGNPDEAQITPEQMGVLERLARHPQWLTAVVSGRSVKQLLGFLHTMAGIPLILSGLHGGERYDLATSTWLEQPAEGYTHTIAQLKVALIAEIAAHHWQGLYVEDKGVSLALHSRHSDEATGSAASQWFEAWVNQHTQASPASDPCRFRLQRGKAVIEAVPEPFHKSRAVDALVTHWNTIYPGQPVLPVYLGDDLTDEAGFEAAIRHGGIGIAVNPHWDTAAQYQLPDVDAVYALFDTLLTRIPTQ